MKNVRVVHMHKVGSARNDSDRAKIPNPSDFLIIQAMLYGAMFSGYEEYGKLKFYECVSRQRSTRIRNECGVDVVQHHLLSGVGYSRPVVGAIDRIDEF